MSRLLLQKIQIPAQVQRVLEALTQGGFEAYVVGGCVRDSIMGNQPKDWDVCTSATPEQYLDCFIDFHVIETGLKHGTVTVLMDNELIEVTSYRIDGTYTDSRRPDFVHFTTSLQDDLSRRDFTMNALAYNDKDGLQDFFQGYDHIQKKQIKCVGNPSQRFEEDALRILRALRFCSILGFDIEEATLEASKNSAHLLKYISRERIYDEFTKLLCGKFVSKSLKLGRMMICECIPAMNEFDVNEAWWDCNVSGVAQIRNEKKLRLVMFFISFGSKKTAEILLDLKCDRNTLECVTKLISYSNVEISPEKGQIKRWLNKLGEEHFRNLLEVQLAILSGNQQEDYKDETIKANQLHEVKREIEKLEIITRILDEILVQRLCYSRKDLQVDGNDLLKFGIQPGKEIGRILDRLLELVMDEQIENKKALLLEQAKSIALS